MGEGTNLVPPDFFDGIVIKPNFNEVLHDSNNKIINVGAPTLIILLFESCKTSLKLGLITIPSKKSGGTKFVPSPKTKYLISFLLINLYRSMSSSCSLTSI